MPENVFLTEARRDVLNGEHDAAESTTRTQKSNIRTQSRMALEELQEVAESPHIDSRDVFDPKAVAQLLYKMMLPEEYVSVFDDPPEDWQEYQNELYVEIDQVLRLYQEERNG